MPVANPSTVRKQIKSGNTDSLYLLLGEDDGEKSALAAEFAEIVDEGLRAFNVERIHAGDMTTGDKLAGGVASLVAAARTLPMMSPGGLFLVLLAAPLDKLLRMFKVLTKHATVAECGSPEDVAGAEGWVRARVATSG